MPTVLAPEVIKWKVSQSWFSTANFFDMRDMKIKMTPSFSPRRAGSEHVLFDLESSISKSDLRSGQGQVMTQVGQYAYLPRRLDEPSRLARFARLYLHPVASYWRKMDCDLI